MSGRPFLTLSGTSFTPDSPSQATQSNDSNVKTPVAVILGSLFGAALLVLLILGSVFIIRKRRKSKKSVFGNKIMIGDNNRKQFNKNLLGLLR